MLKVQRLATYNYGNLQHRRQLFLVCYAGARVHQSPAIVHHTVRAYEHIACDGTAKHFHSQCVCNYFLCFLTNQCLINIKCLVFATHSVQVGMCEGDIIITSHNIS